MGSPLGVIYTTNITPDAETGIGRYSLEDFDRAVRSGVAAPVIICIPPCRIRRTRRSPLRTLPRCMPTSCMAYSRCTGPIHANRDPLVSEHSVGDADLERSVPEEAEPIRSLPITTLQWNRGAYLVQGLGHCGACHTPRGLLFQEKALTQDQAIYLSGASLDNWSAADLRGDNPYGLGRWSEAQLVEYLKTGHNASGTAFGSMIDAINYSTQFLTDARQSGHRPLSQVAGARISARLAGVALRRCHSEVARCAWQYQGPGA